MWSRNEKKYIFKIVQGVKSVYCLSGNIKIGVNSSLHSNSCIEVNTANQICVVAKLEKIYFNKIQGVKSGSGNINYV